MSRTATGAFHKKLLAFAVTSVLAGWVGSSSAGTHFARDNSSGDSTHTANGKGAFSGKRALSAHAASSGVRDVGGFGKAHGSAHEKNVKANTRMHNRRTGLNTAFSRPSDVVFKGSYSSADYDDDDDTPPLGSTRSTDNTGTNPAPAGEQKWPPHGKYTVSQGLTHKTSEERGEIRMVNSGKDDCKEETGVCNIVVTGAGTSLIIDKAITGDFTQETTKDARNNVMVVTEGTDTGKKVTINSGVRVSTAISNTALSADVAIKAGAGTTVENSGELQIHGRKPASGSNIGILLEAGATGTNSATGKVYVITPGGIGVKTTGVGSTGLNKKDGMIFVTGEKAIGMLANNNGVNTNMGTISVNGRGAIGMESNGQVQTAPDPSASIPATTAINGDTIDVQGTGATGMLARNQGKTSNQGTITASGTNSVGVHATEGGEHTNSGTIKATGEGAIGVKVELLAKFTNTGSITSNGVAVTVTDIGDTIFQTGSAVTGITAAIESSGEADTLITIEDGQFNGDINGAGLHDLLILQPTYTGEDASGKALISINGTIRNIEHLTLSKVEDKPGGTWQIPDWVLDTTELTTTIQVNELHIAGGSVLPAVSPSTASGSESSVLKMNTATKVLKVDGSQGTDHHITTAYIHSGAKFSEVKGVDNLVVNSGDFTQSDTSEEASDGWVHNTKTLTVQAPVKEVHVRGEIPTQKTARDPSILRMLNPVATTPLAVSSTGGKQHIETLVIREKAGVSKVAGAKTIMLAGDDWGGSESTPTVVQSPQSIFITSAGKVGNIGEQVAAKCDLKLDFTGYPAGKTFEVTNQGQLTTFNIPSSVGAPAFNFIEDTSDKTQTTAIGGVTRKGKDTLTLKQGRVSFTAEAAGHSQSIDKIVAIAESKDDGSEKAWRVTQVVKASAGNNNGLTRIEAKAGPSGKSGVFAIKNVELTGDSNLATKPTVSGNDDLDVKKLVVLTPAPAPDYSSSGATPLSISAETTGQIKQVTIMDKATFGSITNVDSVQISGGGTTGTGDEKKLNPAKAWQSFGVVTNPSTISVTGHVDAIKGSSVAPTAPQTLHVTGQRDLTIENKAGKSIGTVQFGDAGPNIRFVQGANGNADVKINLSDKKTNVLVLESKENIPTKENMSGINGYGFTGKDALKAMGELKDLKRLELGLPVGTIQAVGTDPLIIIDKTKTQLAQVGFSSAQPESFYLKLGKDAATATPFNTVNFSLENRPDTTFEVAAGANVGKLSLNDKRKDKLVLSGGTLKGDHRFESIDITGTGWTTDGQYSGVNTLTVADQASLSSLYVDTTPGSTPDTEALKVTSTAEKPLIVNTQQGGQLNTLVIGNTAHLGDITLQPDWSDEDKTQPSAGMIEVHGNQWTVGTISGASKLNSVGVIDTVRVGSAPPAPTEKSLSFTTNAVSPLAIETTGEGSKIGTLIVQEGANLIGNIGTVKTVHISANQWSAPGWFEGTEQLTLDNPVDTVNLATMPPSTPQGSTPGNQADTAPEQQTTAVNVKTVSGAPLTIANAQAIKQLNIGDKAGLSSVGAVNNIGIHGKDWTTVNTITNPQSLEVVQGGVATIIADGKTADKTAPGFMHLSFDMNRYEGKDDKGRSVFTLTSSEGGTSTADFTADIDRPTLRFVQNGGTTLEAKGREDKSDVLVIKKGAPAKVSGFKDTEICGSDWGTMEVTDPNAIVVSKGGMVKELRQTDGESSGASASGDKGGVLSLRFTPSPAGESGAKDFTIRNEGGEIDDFHLESHQTRQGRRLVFEQNDGTTKNLRGGSGSGDIVMLRKGSIGSLSDIEHVDIDTPEGADWTLGTITIDKEERHSIDIGSTTTVDSLTVGDAGSASKTVALSFEPLSVTGGEANQEKAAQEQAADTRTLQVTSKGHLARIDLSGEESTSRPAIHIVQTGGTIGDEGSMVKGRKDDTLSVTGTTVGNNIEGFRTVTFAGQGNRFGGNTIGAGTVHVDGALTFGDPLTISGQLNQKGTLCVDECSRKHVSPTLERMASDPDSGALITADAITLGAQARLGFSLGYDDDDSLADEEILLMETRPHEEKAAPINVEGNLDNWVVAEGESYTHYYAGFTDKTRSQIVLKSEDQGSRMGRLVTTKNTSLRNVLMTAANAGKPTGNKKSKAKSSDTGRSQPSDLNQYVVKNVNAGNANEMAAKMAPTLAGGGVDTAKSAIKMAGRSLDDRMSGKRTGIAAGDMFSSGGVWLQYSYNDATQDEKDGVYGYEAKTHGFTVGADSDLNEVVNLGLAYTYAKGEIKGKDVGTGNKMDTDSHIFSLYSSANYGQTFVDARLSYAFGKNDGNRALGGKAEYDSKSWGFGLMAGYTLPLGNEWSWQPQVAFNYATIDTDDYKEEGAASLTELAYDNVSDGKYDILELGAGLKLVGDIMADKLLIKPEFSLMGYHDFKDDPVNMTAHFAQGGNSFVVHGAERDQNRFQFGAAANMEVNDNTTITLSYTYDWADKFKVHGFIARARYDF